MKSHKIKFCLLAAMILISSLMINPTRVRGEEYIPTIGADIREIENVGLVDGDPYGEAINYWVHYNSLKWSEVEKTKGSYTWENNPHIQALDAYLSKMNAAGMEVILTINSTPKWARSHDLYCGPMASNYIGEFAAFVAQAVRRYSREPYSVEYYEIWNEPDSPQIYHLSDPDSEFGCWGDHTDTNFFGGRFYGDVLKQVYPALKAASADAQLVIGGLLLPADPEDDFWSTWKNKPATWVYSNMSKYFKGILEACQGSECFDFVNFHGYLYYGPASAIELEMLAGAPEPFWDERGGQVEGKLAYLKELMDEYSVDKPFILTEAALLGDNITDYDPAFEAVKADYVVYLFTRNMARGIYATTWHHLDNYGWRRSGFLDWNNQPLPAFDAFETLTTNLYGASYVKDLNLGAGIIGFEFTGNTRYWVLFSDDGLTKQINISQLPTWFHTAIDLFGENINIQGTTISFNRPIYIKGNSVPLANDDQIMLTEVAKITLSAPGIMENDIDFDNDTLTAHKVTNTSYGTVTLNQDGSLTYQPNEDFSGLDTFSYRVFDGEYYSNTATVIISFPNLFVPLIQR